MRTWVCAHVYADAWAQVCAYLWRVVVEMSYNHFRLSLCGRVSQSNPELPNMALPASQLTLGIPDLCFLSAGIAVKPPPHPCGTYMGSLLFAASTLATEPSSQPSRKHLESEWKFWVIGEGGIFSLQSSQLSNSEPAQLPSLPQSSAY